MAAPALDQVDRWRRGCRANLTRGRPGDDSVELSSTKAASPAAPDNSPKDGEHVLRLVDNAGRSPRPRAERGAPMWIRPGGERGDRSDPLPHVGAAERRGLVAGLGGAERLQRSRAREEARAPGYSSACPARTSPPSRVVVMAALGRRRDDRRRGGRRPVTVRCHPNGVAPAGAPSERSSAAGLPEAA